MSLRCPIWGTPAHISHIHNRDAFRVRSPRAGGDYGITGTAAAMIKNGYLDEPSMKAKVTTALVDRRRDGEDVPFVDSGFLDRYRRAKRLTHAERAERLLRYLADRENASAGDPVGWGATDPAALAHSGIPERHSNRSTPRIPGEQRLGEGPAHSRRDTVHRYGRRTQSPGGSGQQPRYKAGIRRNVV